MTRLKALLIAAILGTSGVAVAEPTVRGGLDDHDPRYDGDVDEGKGAFTIRGRRAPVLVGTWGTYDSRNNGGRWTLQPVRVGYRDDYRRGYDRDYNRGWRRY